MDTGMRATTRICAGSANPAKVAAVRQVFTAAEGFRVTYREAPSGVAAQPWGDDETRAGAIHRAQWLIRQGAAPVAVGLEGGVQEGGGSLWLCTWGALATSGDTVVTAGGGRVALPGPIADALCRGVSLGTAVDRWMGRQGINRDEGAIGVLTAGTVTRTELFAHVARLLLGQARCAGILPAWE
ncbi:DUF84 family protein [Aquisalimonas lutea]|uniref:DUF84 family protein n=1 Tax=Aquisalimonas lutea TaxID=1327750 RepID=UPI0025B4707B|nr:DUF84 family protein [Aquisalimonas lutea]MDN3516455.1 DUF84 family protein [Aquisalimonas lutea]